MLIFYNLLFPVLFLLYLPAFLTKLIRRGGSRRHFMQRFGIFSKESRNALQAMQRPVWIHAVSVGEAVAACSFIREWRQREPKLNFVLSTTTTTGHAIAEKKLPPGTMLIYSPLDFYPFVVRTLKLTSPRLLVIFEVEIWPNLVTLPANRGIPVTLVNARMSDKSARGYAGHRRIFGPLFRSFSLFCAQSEQDAERIRRVVGDAVPVHVCNTMKFDQVPAPGDQPDSAIPDQLFGTADRLIWTAASTHAGEEALILAVFTRLLPEVPELKLILVPRHHERTAEVEKTLIEHSVSYVKATDISNRHANDKTVNCLLVNTTGELMKFMALSDMVFMGKTMAGNRGGHNIIEPAILGKPVIHGPNMENFRLVVQLFKDAAATIEVSNAEELQTVIKELCRNPDKRASLGKAARQIVEEHRGAIPKTLDLVSALAN